MASTPVNHLKALGLNSMCVRAARPLPASCPQQEQQDAQSTIAFSTKDWAAWPASLSKLAARILWDPLVLYPVGGPVFMLVGNTCWPGLRRDRSAAWRVLYPLSRCLLLPAYVGAVACTLLGGFSRLLMVSAACCCCDAGD
jgi:hypothetical protein